MATIRETLKLMCYLGREGVVPKALVSTILLHVVRSCADSFKRFSCKRAASCRQHLEMSLLLNKKAVYCSI